MFRILCNPDEYTCSGTPFRARAHMLIDNNAWLAAARSRFNDPRLILIYHKNTKLISLSRWLRAPAESDAPCFEELLGGMAAPPGRGCRNTPTARDVAWRITPAAHATHCLRMLRQQQRERALATEANWYDRAAAAKYAKRHGMDAAADYIMSGGLFAGRSTGGEAYENTRRALDDMAKGRIYG
jgi:hypothetical protein